MKDSTTSSIEASTIAEMARKIRTWKDEKELRQILKVSEYLVREVRAALRDVIVSPRDRQGDSSATETDEDVEIAESRTLARGTNEAGSASSLKNSTASNSFVATYDESEPQSLILPTLSKMDDAARPNQKKKRRRRKTAYNFFTKEAYPKVEARLRSAQLQECKEIVKLCSLSSTKTIDKTTTTTTTDGSSSSNTGKDGLVALPPSSNKLPPINTEIFKEISKMWKGMTDEQKAPYKAMAEAHRQEVEAKAKKESVSVENQERDSIGFLAKIPSGERPKKKKKTAKSVSNGQSERSKTARPLPPRSTEIVVLSQNPKRGKSFERYERYKRARTVQEYFDLGGLRADFFFDMDRSFLMLKTAVVERLVSEGKDVALRAVDRVSVSPSHNSIAEGGGEADADMRNVILK